MINKIDLVDEFYSAGNKEESDSKQREKIKIKRKELEDTIIKGLELESLYGSLFLRDEDQEYEKENLQGESTAPF